MRKLIGSFFIIVLLGFFTVASAQLPPEIQADKNMVLAEQLYATKDYAEAFKVMEKVIALQQEHSLTLSDEFHFKYAQVALSADSTRIALEQVGKYLSATGKVGEFYKEALALLIEIEGTQISVEDMCTEKPKGSSCWQELTNHPECYVWNEYYDEDRTVSWSGKCSGNLAQGTGELSWEKKNKDGKLTWGSYRDTGSLKRGKKHGQWVWRSSMNSETREGSYVEGKKDGPWVTRGAGGHPIAEERGSYKEGKKHGLWITSKSNGDPKNKKEIYYVEGKKDGRWVSHSRYQVAEGSYKDDKEHGKWVWRFWSGAVLHGSYKEGKEHGTFYGQKEMCGPDRYSLKATIRGEYVEGKRQGYWKGEDGSGHYDEDGLRQGTWTILEEGCYGPSSSSRSGWNVKQKGDYIDGKKEGTWLKYFIPYRGVSGDCRSLIYHQGRIKENKSVNMKNCRGM